MRSDLRLAIGLMASLACSSSDGQPDGGTFGTGGAGSGGAGGSGGAATPRYRFESVEGCPSGGYQTSLAAAGGTVALATLATTAATTTCMSMNGPVEVKSYDICYAESAGGGAFAATRVSSEGYLALTGVGLGLAPDGTATLAFTGGQPAALRCGAGDLMVASGRGAALSTRTAAEGSQSGGLAAGMEASCIQNVCNSGDATGYFPAVAVSSQGEVALAWRDLHFGFANDDFASSDVEVARGVGSQPMTVDVSRGGGTSLRIAFTPDGLLGVAHYNGEREAAINGIYVNREVAGGWEARRLTGARAGEQLGFAISPAGTWSLAFYDEDMPRLVYLESPDGASWADPVDVDTDGIIGQHPSLAFGPDGEPAVAYYRCNDYDPRDRNCDDDRDGLYLARRSGGRWRSHAVRARGGVFDGLYPALAFAGGKAVIAFQERTFDPSTGQNEVSLHVAREE